MGGQKAMRLRNRSLASGTKTVRFLGADEFDDLFRSGHQVNQEISRPCLLGTKRVTVCRPVVARTGVLDHASCSRFEF